MNNHLAGEKSMLIMRIEANERQYCAEMSKQDLLERHLTIFRVALSKTDLYELRRLEARAHERDAIKAS